MSGIDPEDLDVSTIRPAGDVSRWRLNVTETDPYVRITHKPSGITVERDAERSRLMNMAAAVAEIGRQLADRQMWRDESRPPEPVPGQLNPALLIRDREVAAMQLAPGNVLRVLVDGYWQASKVLALSVDADGVPCLILGDAGTDDMDAREAEARRIGGPVAP